MSPFIFYLKHTKKSERRSLSKDEATGLNTANYMKLKDPSRNKTLKLLLVYEVNDTLSYLKLWTSRKSAHNSIYARSWDPKYDTTRISVHIYEVLDAERRKSWWTDKLSISESKLKGPDERSTFINFGRDNYGKIRKKWYILK